jgi:RecA-family ATPase
VLDTVRPRALSMLDHALSAAEKGFPVFPVEPFGKVPLISDWPNRATIDPKVIRQLWTDALGEPQPYNVGIAVSEHEVVLDYDVKGGKRGLESYQQMLADGLPQDTLTVTTPTGGLHVYLKASSPIGNSAEKIAPGVDVRSRGGYVLAPGSSLLVDGKVVEYKVINDAPLADAPKWLWSKPGTPNKEDVPLSAAPDHDAIDYAVKLATDYLINRAPQAIEGAGGDATTYSVALRMKDFGVPEDLALDLLLEYWNDTKASPPWQPDDLEVKVRNAYRYAESPLGHLSAAFEFEHVDIPLTADHLAHDIDPDDPFPAFTNFSPIDPRSLPRRVFVFDGVIAKKTLAALNAPSGVGKTQFTVQLALSAATGRNIAGLKPATRRPQTVAYWNNEDEADELRRRMLATAIHFGIDQAKLTDHIRFASGVSRKLIIAGKDKSGVVRATKHADKLITLLRDMRADMLVLDPLVEFHSCDENSNVEMAAVAGVLRQIAVEADVAVLMLHHDRKPDSASSQGFAGSQHAMRGASSLQGVTRAILTLYGMAEKDAAAWGVSEDQRHLYLRLDQAKNNLGLVGGEPIWFRRTSVALQDEIGGDVVGVLDPIEMSKLQKAEKTKSHELQIDAVVKAMEGAGLLWVGWPSVEAHLLASGYRSEASWRRWLNEIATGERALEMFEMKGVDNAESLVKREIYIRKKGADFLD